MQHYQKMIEHVVDQLNNLRSPLKKGKTDAVNVVDEADDEYILRTNSNMPRPVPTASGDAHDNIYDSDLHLKLVDRSTPNCSIVSPAVCPENHAGT